MCSYIQYKESTQKILRWIEEASRDDKARAKTGGKGIQLSLRDITVTIESLTSKEFKKLSPTLQGSFQDLLGQCSRAIRLRELVSSRYDESSAGYAGHINFISCLKDWFISLKQWGSCKDDEREERGVSSTTNLFNHLDVDDGDDDDDDDDDDDEKAPDGYLHLFMKKEDMAAGDSSAKELETAFEEDLTLQLLLFLRDLEDISEQVSNAWLDVKNETTSIFTAATVTCAAISVVKRLSKSLQLNFPSIGDYLELHTVMEKYFPERVFQNSAIVCHNDCEAFLLSQKRQYTKGAEMFEISTISNVLNSFALSLEVHDGFMLPREGVFGKSFDENSWPLDSTVQMMMTPLQFGAENARISVFLLTELPRLRNLGFFIAGDGGRDREYMCNSMGPFYITMKKFFDDRQLLHLSHEILQSRVFSRDSLVINDELYEIFEEMTDLFGRRSFYEHYVVTGQPQGHEKQSVHYRLQRAGEDSVMIPLIYLLDLYNPAKPTALASASELTNGKSAIEYIRTAADYIHHRFSDYPSVEDNFFLFPARTDLISSEFGTANVMTEKMTEKMVYPDGRDEVYVYSKWMDRLEDDPAPLSQCEILKLKMDIRYDPSILFLFTPTNEKSMIFHFIVDGPHSHLELAEWMINMGVLNFEKKTMSNSLWPRFAYTAVAFAVKSGNSEMAKLILSSDNFKCVNMQFGADEDSLAHLAVKSGSRNLISYLRYNGSIDLSILNNKRKKFYEVISISDSGWLRELKSHYDQHQNSLLQNRNYKPRTQELHDRGDAKMQALEDGLASQKKAAGSRSRKGRDGFSVPPPPSAQSIDAAAKAEAELLALLEAEASATASSKSSGGNGKGGGKSKKKK